MVFIIATGKDSVSTICSTALNMSSNAKDKYVIDDVASMKVISVEIFYKFEEPKNWKPVYQCRHQSPNPSPEDWKENNHRSPAYA
jgi:hypothetical protein